MGLNRSVRTALVLLCGIFSTLAGETTWAQNGDEYLATNPETFHDHGIVAEVAGGYRWGTYSSPAQADTANNGAATSLLAGYRFSSGWEGGLTADFAFPQISALDTNSNASLSYRAFGVMGGCLLINRFEPFLHYSPVAQLTQSTTSQTPGARLTSDLTYTGAAYGAGAKLFLTDRNINSVQVGLKFIYTHETYSRSSFSTTSAATSSNATPTLTPSIKTSSVSQDLSGNAYQLALFIGL